MEPLAKPQRKQLEDVVVAARDKAETAAHAALMHLGVSEAEAPGHLTDEERALRRRLRAHGRQVGDNRRPDGRQSIDHLVQETAYEHWHRMLFARFLAENHLLMHPDGVPVTLAECDELARYENAADGWELAGRYASRMLPQIFRPDSPVLALALAPEHQRALEKLLAGLNPDTFQASDSLGWVYQFWQTKKKDQVNASEVKIGAEELPAVTQLFTEPYMVAFLLDNSLGAWWAARRLSEDDLRNAKSEEALRRKAAIPGVPLEYLRFTQVEAASSRFSQNKRQDGTSTSEPYGYYKKDEPVAIGAGNLPHWRQEGVTYFVTFRTADSLPKQKLTQWQEEKRVWLIQHPEPHDAATRHEYERLFNARIEYWLDQGYGSCLLQHTVNKKTVENALRHFDGQRYHLGEFVVMPNHVHALITPIGEHQLSEILHSWKSFTANTINKREGLNGGFWQKEYFDHIVRNPDQMERVILYIKQNPIPRDEHDLQALYEETFRTGKKETPDDSSRSAILAFSEQQSAGRDDLGKAAGSDNLGKAAGSRFYPAAGTFDAWSEHLGELKVMDPCCGSGHFLVAAFQMLVPMRMQLERLSAQEAVAAVLRDNLHGLELDQRCVEIAAFALALAAWRYPDAGGYRPLPGLNVACSGLGIHAAKADWLRLADGDVDLEHALERLYDLFKDAPTLGSLIKPHSHFGDGLFAQDWGRIAPLLDRALVEAASSRLSEQDQRRELGVVAQGLSRSAQLLAEQYHLVITNVPYLSRGKQSARLKTFCETHYPNAKNDLANVFLERCLELAHLDGGGVVQIVMPQNWLFLSSYRKQRERLLREVTWNLLVRLGPGAFETISGEVVKAILLTQTRARPVEAASSRFQNTKRQDGASTVEVASSRLERPNAAGSRIYGLDASSPRKAVEKARLLRTGRVEAVSQEGQLGNPDARVLLVDSLADELLETHARSFQGIKTGDDARYRANFWEVDFLSGPWIGFQSTVGETAEFGGLESCLRWEDDGAVLARRQGLGAWHSQGVAVAQMRNLPVAIYLGGAFDSNIAPVIPNTSTDLAAIWCYCSSSDYVDAVRCIDQKVAVANATVVKVPFNLPHWQKVAAERYPNGLPKPYSDDPTQWIFHGQPKLAESPLQTAIARLLGYRWPAEVEAASSRFPDTKRQDGASTGVSTMELSDQARTLITEAQKLNPHSDEDGIVCLPAIRGEPAAHERLLHLLEAAWGDDWTAGTLTKLLADTGTKGKSLDVWLRDYFFQQHCKLFHNRPFIWHIWDGLKDGFAALVNYHKLDRANLERLVYTYLGDWIRMQERAAGEGVQGADERLAAAKGLKDKLEAILEGEAPLDIFVRWKPIEQQSIGWEPDLNDGVRLNIRPFMLAGDVGKKGASVLRAKPNIHWKKDRGKDVESAPWYHLFQGNRINDHHLALGEKRAARVSEKGE